MRIVIDARFYGPFGKGLGRYVQKLVTHLERLITDHDVIVLLRKENFDEYVPDNPKFTKVLADFRWYSLEEQWKLPKLLRSLKPDLVHFPHYNVPLLFRGSFVVTIHDLILSKYPTQRATTLSPLAYAVKNTAYNIIIRSAVRRARAVLTVSEYSKKEIETTFGIPSDRITVTYEAADPFVSAGLSEDVRRRCLGLQPYLLYVGNAYPHKNLERLLGAFAVLRKGSHPTLRLVLVGKMDYFYERLRQEVTARGLAESVVFAGFVPDDELATLYQCSSIYVFPSLIEGFGLPPLEAMRAGVVVASSNRTSLPEVLGDAAAYFNPEDPHDIAAVLDRILVHPDEQKRLRAQGFQQVRRYDWGTLARTTLDVYTGK